MGRRNTQLRPTFFENKCQKRWLRIEQPKPCPGLIWAASLRLSDSSVEVLAEHLIRWCCIDRLNRHNLRGTGAEADTLLRILKQRASQKHRQAAAIFPEKLLLVCWKKPVARASVTACWSRSRNSAGVASSQRNRPETRSFSPI